MSENGNNHRHHKQQRKQQQTNTAQTGTTTTLTLEPSQNRYCTLPLNLKNTSFFVKT